MQNQTHTKKLINLNKTRQTAQKQMHMAPGGVKKICTGMLKVDFRIFTISILQKAWFCDPSLYQIAAKNTKFWTDWVLFWPKFPKYTQFCKLDTLGLKRKPTHRYTNNDKKAPLNLWASPYTINQWVPPPRHMAVLRDNLFLELIVCALFYCARDWTGFS